MTSETTSITPTCRMFGKSNPYLAFQLLHYFVPWRKVQIDQVGSVSREKEEENTATHEKIDMLVHFL